MQITDEIRSQIREAREARGWSQADLASHAGTNQQTIDRIESGPTRFSRAVPALLSALGIVTTQARSPSVHGASPTLVSGEDLTGERDLPVHASVEGGDGAIIVSPEPIEYVKRPAPLIGVRGGYGMYVVGDSMNPRYEAGDTVLVHPHRPPVPNVDVVLYRADRNGDHVAIVKRLRRAAPDRWLLRQWNPPEGESPDFELLRSEWPICHVIVGSYSKR